MFFLSLVGAFFLYTIYVVLVSTFFNVQEIFWKFIYFLALVSLYFLLFFSFSDKILYLFNLSFFEVFILKEPQEYINLLVFFASLFTFLFTLFLVPFFLFTFIINLFHVKKILIFYLFIYYYMYVYTLIILHYDLATSSWDIFAQTKQFYFDLQPSLEYVFYSYWEEFCDFSIFVFFYFLFQFFVINYFLFFYRYKKLKFLFLLCFSFFILFFFGGDSYESNFLILFLTFICYEIYFIILLFLFQLKKFKI